MKSINVMKILEEEETKKTKERKGTDDQTTMNNKLWDFIDNFIMPNILKKIDITEVEQATYEDMLFEMLLEIDDFIEDEDNHLFNEEEINILHSKDRKLKIDMGKRYANWVIRLHTEDTKAEEYFTKYAKPMLEELHKQNIIIYDPKALDNKTKIATSKIDKLVKKIINDKTTESKTYSLFRKLFGNEYIEKNDIIFGDDKEQKEKFCNCIKTYIENNYNNIDYKNIDNINFADMKEFELD